MKLQFAPAAPLNTKPFVLVLAAALIVNAQSTQVLRGVAMHVIMLCAVTGMKLIPTKVLSAPVLVIPTPANVEVQLTFAAAGFMRTSGESRVVGCTPINVRPDLLSVIVAAEVCAVLLGRSMMTSPTSDVA